MRVGARAASGRWDSAVEERVFILAGDLARSRRDRARVTAARCGGATLERSTSQKTNETPGLGGVSARCPGLGRREGFAQTVTKDQ